MIIREAVPTDGEAVLTLARAFHLEDGHPLPSEAQSALAALLEPGSPNGFIVVAESGSQLGGYGAVCFGFSVEYGGRDAFLDDLYVTPPNRANGVARALLDALVEMAREKGVRFLHLEVMPQNTIEAWYRRRGFLDRGSKLMTKALGPRA